MTFDTFTTYFRKAHNGDAYIVSELFTVSAGDSVNLYLQNPPDSGKKFWITSVKADGAGPYESEMSDGFTSGPSGGTTVEIQNVLMDEGNGGTDDGVATVKKNVSYTADSTHAVGVSTGSAGADSIGGQSTHPSAIIEQSREIVFSITNTDTEEHTYALTIAYYETAM